MDRLTVWRLAPRRYVQTPADAYSGAGAARYGGRWNPRGTPVAYASATLSLAALELLAQTQDRRVLRSAYVVVSATFDEALAEALAPHHRPVDWRRRDPPPSTQALGHAWATEARALALRVPSAILPDEPNYVLNPEHPAFAHVTFGPLRPLDLDARFEGGV